MFNVIVQKGANVVGIESHTLLSDAIGSVDNWREVYSAHERVSTVAFPSCRLMYRNDDEKILVSAWVERPFCTEGE